MGEEMNSEKIVKNEKQVVYDFILKKFNLDLYKYGEAGVEDTIAPYKEICHEAWQASRKQTAEEIFKKLGEEDFDGD